MKLAGISFIRYSLGGKTAKDLREHPRGMVHLVRVINVPRAFTYTPTLMIANVLFSVSRCVYYFRLLLFFSPSYVDRFCVMQSRKEGERERGSPYHQP